MKFNGSTEALLSTLETLSANRIRHKDDLGLVLKLALTGGRTDALEQLSFYAKFTSRSYGIMKRIGAGAEGYDKLEMEFGESLEKVKQLIEEVFRAAPPEVREQFRRRYLSLTPDAMQQLVELLHDVSWYKNWLIDQRSGAR
jgi:hypothetical protein